MTPTSVPGSPLSGGRLPLQSAIRPRVLVVSAAVPFPPIGGGPLRTFHVLRALARHNDVTLVGFTFAEDTSPPPFPIEVIAVPWEAPQLYRDMQGEDRAAAERAAELLDGGIPEPWFVSFYACPAMVEALKRVCAQRFDLVVLEDTDMAQFLPCLPQSTPRIMDLHNVYTLMARRAVETAPAGLVAKAEREAARTLAFEAHAARQCDLLLACSGMEADAARRLLGTPRVEVVPNGVDTGYFVPAAEPASSNYILFTGTMSHPPNEEAALHFIEAIFPLVRARVPDAEFHIVGKQPSSRLLAAQAGNVFVHGAVAEVRPFFRSAAVVVAPIMSGGGTRLKILEAGACGKAIVSTSLGAEGLGLEHGRHLLLGDDPESFASGVCQLLGDPKLRTHLGSAIRQATLAFDWEIIESRVSEIVGRLTAGESRPRGSAERAP